MSKLLFDIGGTHTRLAFSKKIEDDFCEPIIFETPETIDSAMDLWQQKIEQMKKREGVDNIGLAIGGIPGTLDKKRNVLKRSPNLPAWKDKEIRDTISNTVEAKVKLFNDADMVGLGEANYGAGTEFDIVMYLTVSTGIGGTRIVDGDIDRAAIGFEPGHQYILGGNIGKMEDFEDLASGSGLSKKYGKKPEDIESEIYQTEVINHLAIGIHNSILHWSPEVVVIGGGIGVNEFDMDTLRNKVNQITDIFYEMPEFKLAEFDDFGGLYGALAYSNN